MMVKIEEPICRSCGMPLVDPHYYGTDKKGNPTDEYCHYCFQEGAFLDQGISMDDKIQKNIDIAVKMGNELPRRKQRGITAC